MTVNEIETLLCNPSLMQDIMSIPVTFGLDIETLSAYLCNEYVNDTAAMLKHGLDVSEIVLKVSVVFNIVEDILIINFRFTYK